ncbi:MAG: FHA domain-containing protein [Archangiaceae bacterium]|nr:FHA domain-containing protein [Archangiaceae bacterium]
MTRTRRTVEISDALWEALELMSREMSVDRDALVNQALFTFARFNGYVTPGSVAPHAQAAAPGPAATASAAVAQPLASPPNAVRRAQEEPPAPGPSEPPAPGGRMATGSIAAVSSPPPASTPPSPPPVMTEAAQELSGPAPTTDPQNVAQTGSNPATEQPAPAAQTGANEEEEEPVEPPQDENLDDGLDALPENGAIEWKVPPFILADKAVALVKGTVKGHDFQGSVQAFDKKGTLLRTLELGGSVEDERVESVLVHEVREPRAWKQLSQQLAKEGHIGEATLALIRAIGAGEPLQTLNAWFTEHTIVRSERAALERAQKAGYVLSNMNRFGAPPPRKASYLVEELLQGAFPASICRELAIDQDQYASSRAAGDLIRAAKALNPDDKPYYAYTQALIEMSLGNPDAARVCADELRERSEEQADFLTTYLHGLFPKFGFWAGEDGVASLELDVEAQPSARKLADFRNAILKAALRVKSVRDHLLALVPAETPWLPPSVDALLARGKITLTDDEQVGLDEWQLKSIPQLMRFMRNEWARLTWLCWLAGLDAVGVPTATSKPRSPSIVHRALGLRQHLFVIKNEETSLEDGFEEVDREDARRVSTIPWCDTTPAEIDGANASELALPEVATALAAVEWAANAEVASPFAEAGSAEEEEDEEDDDDDDGEGEGADEGEDDEAGADDDAPDDEGEEPAAAADDDERDAPEPVATAPSAHTAQQPAAEPPPEDAPSEPAERTAIVRPSGRKIWVMRENHETIELVGLRFTVGRDPRCEIAIASPRVSREHAAILVDADTVLVTDLNSSNGTFFNGERVMRHVVNDGDVVQFGNEKVTFRFTEPE